MAIASFNKSMELNNMNIINKDNYEEISEEIKKIVNEVDPIHLTGGGAPSDEYDPEINRIISNLNDIDKVDDVTKIVDRIFKDSFKDMEIDKQTIKNIAEKIEKLFNK